MIVSLGPRALRTWPWGATFLAILLPMVAACAPARRAWQPTIVPGALTASAYAVVWRGAPLHVAPDRTAPAVSLLGPDLTREPWARAAFAPFRLVHEESGWVELETLGAPAPEHCAPDITPLEDFRLRFFVPREALMTVTTRESSQRFGDGTSIALSRGVPIERVGGEMWRARLGRVSAVVRLAPIDVGTRYLPSAPVDRSPRGLTLSADAIAAGVPILGQTGHLDGERGESMPVYATHGRGPSELLVELRPPCARIEVRVPAHVVTERSSEDDTATEGTAVDGVPEPPGAPSEAPVVDAGTPITFRDGRRAGVVARRTTLSEELDPREGRRCFRVPLRGVPEGTEDESAWLELCFDRREVMDPGAGVAARLDAP